MYFPTLSSLPLISWGKSLGKKNFLSLLSWLKLWLKINWPNISRTIPFRLIDFFFLLNVSIPYLLNFNILIVNLKIGSFSPLTLFFFFSELLCFYSTFHVYVKLRINSSKPAFKNSCLNFGLDFMNLFNSLHYMLLFSLKILFILLNLISRILYFWYN